VGRPPTCLCGECGLCKQRVISREWYRANAERGRENARKSRLRRVEAIRAYDRERGYREYDREKAKARRAINHALFAGRMTKQPCEKCGDAASEAHHDDYSKPLDVRWFCRPHHAELHRRFGIEEAA
jgi:hypothetical protein